MLTFNKKIVFEGFYMNIMNMSKYDLKKIKKFSLARGLINTEAELFILKVNNDWNLE